MGSTQLYADDTAISIAGYSQEDLETKLSIALRDSITWMRRNKLTLNTDKTKAMCFGTPHTIRQVTDPTIVYGDIEIELVDDYKYLGVVLDPTLKFYRHVDYLKRKIVGRLRMLSKLRPIMNEETSLTLYKSLLITILDYSDIIYDCLSKYNTDILQKSENGA